MTAQAICFDLADGRRFYSPNADIDGDSGEITLTEPLVEIK